MTVSIVDYGLGNLGSVANMLKRVGATARFVKTPDEVRASDRVLLPGVGAFDSGVELLRGAELIDPIREFAATGRPVLGICLGMQLLLDSSEEGQEPGLGLITGRSKRFADVGGLRVPHMGWNIATPVRSHPLVEGLPDESRFYFVHTYHVVPDDQEAVLATTAYGPDFTSMVQVDNVMGAQFHPEKSHTFGMTVLRNFAQL